MPIDRDVAPAPADLEPGLAGPGPIRVILADDHALTRRVLRQLLDAVDRVEVVGEATDLSAVKRQVLALRPEVLVIDLGMSNGSSIETIRHLRRRAPGTQIVVLTMEHGTVFAQEALDAGAIGFVLKHTADAELAAGVLNAAQGVEYVSRRVAARLALLRRASA